MGQQTDGYQKIALRIHSKDLTPMFQWGVQFPGITAEFGTTDSNKFGEVLDDKT
jgi:hypothetical protein